ncbi:hypothetical protein [Trichloromonas sp.]|uniref:hypothetical protein n=1 Tax=Trichloromonas sp. TaxID=3069249 RepID=UPI002A4C28CD|nr:hypothetical protein [Trichloromonas sp.]
MKAIARIAAATAVLSSVATSALAASGNANGSGILIWVFLGFCGVIIAAQLIPALLVMFGIVKGVMAPREETAEQTHK